MIREIILITTDKTGRPQVSPIGLIQRDSYWVIAPFRPSQTLENLYLNPYCTASLTDDARVFAGCVTGRHDWPLTATRSKFPQRLTGTLAHWELEVTDVEEDPIRPRFLSQIRGCGVHAPFSGHNRAYGAVVEAAILVSRLHLVPISEIESTFSFLNVIVSKCGGPHEVEAFQWLETELSNFKLKI